MIEGRLSFSLVLCLAAVFVVVCLAVLFASEILVCLSELSFLVVWVLVVVRFPLLFPLHSPTRLPHFPRRIPRAPLRLLAR